MKRLQSLSYKTLFTIFFLALAGIVFFLKIGSKTEKVSAAWWDEMWHYRKAISIENDSGSDLTDFQVSISIGTSQLIADGKMQTDCDDIRITDINGNLLPYWIEPNTCNTDTTNIYTKINSLFTNGISVYIYYGNNSAESASDATAVPQTCSKVNSYFGTNLYYINPEGKKNSTPVQAYCDMTTDGGGWTLVASWNTSQEWTKASYSSSDVFGTTAKDTVSSNFGNAPINDFRILASDTITSIGTSAYADWYYHYNSTTTWKEVWARSSNIGGNIDSTYRSTTTRQSLKPFNYSYNIKFSYQVTQTYNNLSDWGINTSSYYGLPNYWLALTSPGNKFGIYGAVAGGGANDGSLAICPSNISNCISGQDMSTNNCKIGYDDNIPSASFGSIGTTSVNQNPPIEVTTKLWWFIRDGTPVSNAYSVSSSSSEEVGTGPIAYWKFDEGNGTTSYDSMGINNGTIYGTTWQNEDQCISGKCLYFNGTTSDYVSIPNSKSLQITGNQTISMWLKPTAFGARRNPIDKAYGGEGTITLESNGSMNYYWGTAGTNTSPYQGFSSSSLTLNQWNLISLVRDITNNKLTWYINGKQTNQVTPAYSQATASTTNIRLGTGYAGSFIGYMDEVKLYPYARTADQIKQDYNSRGSLSGSSANLGVQSNTNPPLKTKMVAHWRLDETNGSIIKDYSGHNFIGTLSSGNSSPTWSINGKFNSSLSFDGNDSITLSNEIVSTSSIRTNGITYSAWIKPTTVSGTQKIFGQKPSSGYSDLASGGIDLSSGKARMIAYDDNIAYKYATGDTTLIANQWYLVTGVYDPSDQKIKIYVNGKFDGGETSIVTFNRLIANNYNLVGSYNHSSRFFNGLIDEIKIYNYALTPDEIKQDYNAGSAIQFGSTNQTIGGTTTSLEYCIPGDTSYCASPVAEWKMDEGVGTSIVDTSGNNNTGTISGATWNQGKIGKGLKFNGSNNYIEVSSTPSTTGSFTISTWVKAINGSTSDGYGYIIHRSNVSSIGGSVFFLGINPTGNYIGAVNGHYANGDTGIAANENIWRFLTLSYDGNTQKVYVDGQLKSNYSFGAITNTTTDNKIGFGGTPLYLNYRNIKGQMDQVRIYDYARTPAQIAYDYNKGGPVGWWKFDECQGNTAYDWSGIGNTGVISIGSGGSQNSLGTCAVGTSAAWTNGATGKINSSLNFDGTDDRVSIGNPSSLQVAGTKNFSVAAWVYATQNKCGREGIDKASNTICGLATRGGWSLGGNSSSLIFHVSDSTNSQYRSLNFTAQLNTWYHLVGVRNGNNLYLYVDGKLNQTGDVTGFVIDDTNNLSIGGNTSGAWLWPGQLDDVRIYNYALTSEQIKNIYNGGAVNFQ